MSVTVSVRPLSSSLSPSFSDLGVPEDLVRVLAARGITAPFDVQRATIPDALAGRDVCGRSPTGSGKTLAFGIPLVMRVAQARPGRPRALVLVPTRELGEQIRRELEPLAVARRRRVMAVFGGVGLGPQIRTLRSGVDIVVACPGRLVDLLEQKALSLEAVDLVVIDEADRMADMGFLPVVRRLLDRTARERQTLLFSATLDRDVAVLTRNYQKRPVRHEVGPAEPDARDARHVFWQVPQEDRRDHVADVIAAKGSTIVFCRTRHGADRLAKQLRREGQRVVPLHGGRSQGQRDRALAEFTRGEADALVATDVAARGIHVDGVACVVHYDLPADAKAYQHRSGRTARAGAAGLVVSLVPEGQHGEFRELQRSLGIPVRLVVPGDVGVLRRRPPGDRPAEARPPSRPARAGSGPPRGRNAPARESSSRARRGRRGRSAAENPGTLCGRIG